MEFRNAEKLIEEMKKMFVGEKAPEKGRESRFKLIIASGNKRIILQPKVTTQRVNTLFLNDSSSVSEEKIKKIAEEIGIEISECWKFWFDERKDPLSWPLAERRDEREG